MEFSPEEIERYARHLVLPEVGGPGQQQLRRARVLVIGAGGLGTPVIQYLAAAGVGTLGVVDHDAVSLSNLQRQVIHGTDTVGMRKVASAAIAVGCVNPHVGFVAHDLRIGAANAYDLVAGYDLVIDGSDNFPTRYVVSDACFRSGRPLVSGAVGRFDGAVTTLKPHENDAAGRPNPTYRCLLPAAPPEGSVPTCAEAGILGVVTGVVGSLMAMEAIREIAGLEGGLVGRLLMYDALGPRFETIAYAWDPANPLNGVGT